MNFKGRFGDRYNILIMVLSVLMLVLVVKLAILTIAEGDYYRDMADNKRLKEIPITAPRGEIRDRNGKLIAGNKPSFTVQLFKDELDNLDKENRNKSVLNLSRVLGNDGVTYLDEFPIELNVFKYKTNEDYLSEELKPKEKVLQIIKDNNLIGELLDLKYNEKEYPEHVDFVVAEYMMQALRTKGIEIPIEVDRSGENVILYYRDDKDISTWKKEYGINESVGAKEALLQLINGNSGIMREVVNHSMSRKIVYDRLTAKGLIPNVKLEEYSLTYDEEYENQKRELMKKFDYVTFDTSGEEDFLRIFKQISLNNFIVSTAKKKNFSGSEGLYAPVEDLLKMLKEEDRDLRFKVKINEATETAEIEYLGKDKMGKNSVVEFIIKKSEELDVLDDFLKADEIRGLAQSQLLKDGINTKISVSDGYEYTFLRDKESIYNKSNKIEKDASAKEAFDKLREKQEISPTLSKYEARSILVINSALSHQSHKAYAPINIAYGLKDMTVAKIEEGLADVSGVDISIEPVRYYPNGETAAHILGYLGRISQKSEIEEYVDEKGYSPNDIIGKTGIEQSFEDNLRGKNGFKRVEVDVFGNTTKVIEEKKPIPGDNIYLSIDLDVQKEAERALEQSLVGIRSGGSYKSKWGNYAFATNGGRAYRNATSGSTVAVNVNNGDVIAMASYPAYDPNLFSTGISSGDWESLFPENEEDQLAPRPLYNIATQTAVQPGSVFKMVTALAGLEQGLSPKRTIRDMGYVSVGNDEFSCYLRKKGGSHGAVDVEKALEVSCNYYFYSLALGMNQKTGENLGIKVTIDDIINMVEQLGMNDKTGIEIKIPSEVSGGAPNPKVKEDGMKNMLRNFLRKNMRSYVAEDAKISDQELENIIEEVVSWTDIQPVLTKRDVVLRLREYGINSERILPGNKEDLADSIKYNYLNQARWTMADTINVTIGQGHNAYTPIQMANYIASITNGGYNNKLTLINNIKDYNNSKIVYEPKRESVKLDLNNPENLESLKRGMLRVSKTGTGRRTFAGVPVNIGSKTGTAEKDGKIPGTNEKYDNFGWFVAFGPYEKPEIAVASIIFQGGSGGNAGPMTRDLIAEYLGLNSEAKIQEEEQLPFKNKLTQ